MGKRPNDEHKGEYKDFGGTTADSQHDDLNLHHSFPKRKAPMDTDNHPDRHTIETEHRHGSPSGPTVPFPPTPSKTDKSSKGPKVPFKGANS